QLLGRRRRGDDAARRVPAAGGIDALHPAAGRGRLLPARRGGGAADRGLPRCAPRADRRPGAAAGAARRARRLRAGVAAADAARPLLSPALLATARVLSRAIAGRI